MYNKKIEAIKSFHVERLKIAKKEAVERSRNTLKGQITEQLVPLMKDLKYNGSDMRFLGNPIDYIVFDGMSEGNIKNVIILEVKTGNSRLNKIQKQIKEAIESGNISFETLRIKVPQ